MGELDGEALDAGVGGELPLEVLVVARVVAQHVRRRGRGSVVRVEPGLGADGAGVGVRV